MLMQMYWVSGEHLYLDDGKPQNKRDRGPVVSTLIEAVTFSLLLFSTTPGMLQAHSNAEKGLSKFRKEAESRE